jgi:glycosyltransferase involved in cell wall biosynthesis
VSQGFPEQRIAVVPNGIDTNRFKPDKALRVKQRRAWNLPPNAVAIGILARLDAMKDHPTFLRAARLLSASKPELRFVCVGEGPERKRLEVLANELGIAGQVSFPGAVDPVASLNAFDVACSSSMSEGFPSAVAEAMACAKPCAVTDVGDSARIVGDFGTVVPPRDAEALAKAILQELALTGTARSLWARSRIVDHYSVGSAVKGTILVLSQTVTGQSRYWKSST